MAFLLGLLALGGAAVLWAFPEKSEPEAELGLLTTLPIYWGEAADLGEMLDGGTSPHWVREELESGYRIRLLDTLDPLADADDTSIPKTVLLAQPRPLSASENVALDQWVRRGGRVLVFADPMLTGESRFSIGDRRRPQDIVLLSPILARWGLVLSFDDTQPAERHEIGNDDMVLPVTLAGRLALEKALSDAPGACRLLLEAVIADCTIGKGRAVVVADAAILQGLGEQSERKALDRLITLAFR